MPNAATAPARPAVGVFEGLLVDVCQAQLPAGADQALRQAAPNIRPIATPGPIRRAAASATFWLLPIFFLAWLTRGRGRFIRFGLGAVAAYLVVLAVAAVIYGKF
jgi:hypothetical protein